MRVYNLREIIGVDECIKAFGVVFGEHFYGCDEFFVKLGSKAVRPIDLWSWKLDLICVQCQPVNKRFFGLA